MNRSNIKTLPAIYNTYVNKVEDIELINALEKYGKALFFPERDKLISLGDKVYAPGKWTVKDMIQHIIDAERIFSYRALRFARHDKTPLPSFEENEYAVTAQASDRELNDLLDEFYVVRDSTILLFKSFTDEMLMREGTMASGNISVLGLGFVIAGHAIHHAGILKERYYGIV